MKTIEDSILEWLEKNEPATISDVARGIGMIPNAVGNIIRVMETNGRLSVTGKPTLKIVMRRSDATR